VPFPTLKTSPPKAEIEKKQSSLAEKIAAIKQSIVKSPATTVKKVAPKVISKPEKAPIKKGAKPVTVKDQLKVDNYQPQMTQPQQPMMA